MKPANCNNHYSPAAFDVRNNGFDGESSTSNSGNKGNSSARGIKKELISPIGSPKPIKRRLLSPELNSTKLAEMMPSSRLSMGMTGRLRDIVAVFPQSDLAAPEKLIFREHTTNLNRRAFAAKGHADVPGAKSKEISFVGKEQGAGEGFEYVLALVDRRTGQPLEFKRTALINFQLCTESESSRSPGNEKSSRSVDYSADFAATLEKKHEDRKRLTLDFGSVRKNKQLDAHIRRSVTNETLEAMTSTAFSSANVLAKGEEEGTEEEKLEKKLSILGQVQSCVLPEANLLASSPGEVYTLDQFVPKTSEDLLQELKEEAMQFFRQNETTQKILNLGIPLVVAKRLGNPLRYGNPARRCCLSLKMVALARLTQTIHKTVIRQIRKLSAKEVETLNFIPPKMLGHIRETYLEDPRTFRGKITYELSVEQRSRILADLLCLLLLFDDPEYTLPISPIVQDFCVPENVLKNLLVAMGCVVSVASEAQALTLNTIRVARLIGPPDGKSKSLGRRSKRQRRTN